MSHKPLDKAGEVIRGEDEPVAKKHPVATWNFIWLIYLGILVLLALGAVLFNTLPA